MISIQYVVPQSGIFRIALSILSELQTDGKKFRVNQDDGWHAVYGTSQAAFFALR